MAFSLGQQRQLPDALLRIGDDALEQRLEVSRHALDGRGVEQIGAVLPAAHADPAAVSRTDNGEIELGAVPCEGQAARLHALERERGVRARSAARTSPGTADCGSCRGWGRAPRPASRRADPDACRRPARSRAPARATR